MYRANDSHVTRIVYDDGAGPDGPLCQTVNNTRTFPLDTCVTDWFLPGSIMAGSATRFSVYRTQTVSFDGYSGVNCSGDIQRTQEFPSGGCVCSTRTTCSKYVCEGNDVTTTSFSGFEGCEGVPQDSTVLPLATCLDRDVVATCGAASTTGVSTSSPDSTVASTSSPDSTVASTSSSDSSGSHAFVTSLSASFWSQLDE